MSLIKASLAYVFVQFIILNYLSHIRLNYYKIVGTIHKLVFMIYS